MLKNMSRGYVRFSPRTVQLAGDEQLRTGVVSLLRVVLLEPVQKRRNDKDKKKTLLVYFKHKYFHQTGYGNLRLPTSLQQSRYTHRELGDDVDISR